MMKKSLVLLFIAASLFACAQKTDDVINAKEVQRIEATLASDDMRGRRSGTPDIERAADFIAAEFKKAGLQPWDGKVYRQEFSMLRPKMTSLKYEANGGEVDAKNIVVVTSEPEVKIDEKSGYEIQTIGAGENLLQKAQTIARSGKNIIAFVDTSLSKNFPRLMNLKRQMFRSNGTAVFILTNEQPREFKIKAEHTFEETRYANVVGILPGKSKKNEYVIFSGHYDHLGIARQPQNGDSIFNGANDDAAGTTAVIMLANYFKKLNNNERTLVFAAFTAEEVGGYGSQYFSRQFDPAQVMAMFNIEMIGTESKWGKNSAYITGYEKTNMGEILQSNLKGSAFTFYPDPYTTQNLFYRSDNATLARLGVPAHTISTSKMDSEPNYHKVSDEISTLDMDNMAEIIRAVAISSKSIIAGKDTPSRVKPESLER
jgi:Zn-dependent M28 family amino/carboxypeptidase